MLHFFVKAKIMLEASSRITSVVKFSFCYFHIADKQQLLIYLMPTLILPDLNLPLAEASTKRRTYFDISFFACNSLFGVSEGKGDKKHTSTFARLPRQILIWTDSCTSKVFFF